MKVQVLWYVSTERTVSTLSSHAVHCGGATLRFKRWANVLSASHLHKVEVQTTYFSPKMSPEIQFSEQS